MAGINFVLFLAIWHSFLAALLPGSSRRYFLPNPPFSHWQSFLVDSFNVLSVPLGYCCTARNSSELLILAFLNSLIWGTCVGLLLHSATMAFHARRARHLPS
jgi:hypothetical protein